LPSEIIKEIKKTNEFEESEVPEDIITKFYLGAVISICTEWISSQKYSKEDILKYFEILIPDNLNE